MQIGDEALQQATALAEERDKLRTHRESAALGLSEGLLCLQAEGLLCDVQLIPSGGAAVHAHKAVLAAASGYFRALFTGPWSASRERLTVDLPDVEQAVLQLVVSILYTDSAVAVRKLLQPAIEQALGSGKLTEVAAILRLLGFLDARYHQQRVEDAVLGWLEPVGRPCPHVFSLWRVGSQLQLPRLCYGVERHACYCLYNILRTSQGPDIAHLSFEALLRVLSCDSFESLSEFGVSRTPDVFWLALVLWIADDSNERLQSVKNWLPEYWRRRSSLSDLTRTSMADSLDVLQARGLGEAESPETKSVLEQLTKLAAQSSARLATGGRTSQSSLLVCGGRGAMWMPIGTSELLSLEQNSWRQAQPLATGHSFSQGAAFPGGMFVTSSSGIGSRQALYDAARDAWEGVEPPSSSSEAGSPATNHMHAAVARFADDIYVVQEHGSSEMQCWRQRLSTLQDDCLGGKSSLCQGRPGRPLGDASTAVDVYSLTRRRWRRSRDLSLARCCHGAAALHRRLYVVGGQPHRSLMRSVESFEPSYDAWIEADCGLREERKYLGLVAHDNLLVAVGGMTGERKRLSSVEAWDPRDSRGWFELPPMSSAKSSAGVAALDGRIFVVGGTNVNEEPLATVEAFDLAAGRWLQMPPLGCARTGHAVAFV